MRSALKELVKACEAGDVDLTCPIAEAFGTTRPARRNLRGIADNQPPPNPARRKPLAMCEHFCIDRHTKPVR